MINLIALGFLLVYVLSNVTLLQSVNALYYFKHLGMIGIALIAGIWWLGQGKTTALGRYVLFFVALLLLALPYSLRFVVLHDAVEFLVFVQYLIFGIAVIALTSALERSGGKAVPRIILLTLGTIGLVALVSGLVSPHLLYNSYWGRPRLLLGFWHPKEVGVLIASVSLLVITSAILRIRPLFHSVLFLFLVLILLLIDTRNTFFFAVLLAGSYLCVAYAGYFTLGVGVALMGATAVWFASSYPLLTDLLLSGRLTLWNSVEYTLLGQGTAIDGGESQLGSKFHIDNFYLEYIYENGVYAVVLLLALALVIGYILKCTPDPRWRRLKLSAALAFFFVSFFDAGMFSTGNFLNVTVWVYILGGERIFGSASSLVAAPAADALHLRERRLTLEY